LPSTNPNLLNNSIASLNITFFFYLMKYTKALLIEGFLLNTTFIHQFQYIL
jgi:hypothetical protein